MKVPNQQNRPFTGANMTPMIDVVFLLIIFFLVSSHLARQESRMPVDLPIAKLHDPANVDPVSVTITINENGDLLLGGSVTEKENLGDIFAQVIERDGESASLRIRSDGRIQYQRVEPVLKAAAASGLLDIKLAVKESSGAISGAR